MKKYIFYLLFLLSFYSTQIIQAATSSNQYECVSVEQEGQITIQIWNSQKGRFYNQTDAQKDALNCVLYSGFNGKNCISQPPLLNSEKENKLFQKIEKKFFSNRGNWIQFVRSSSISIAFPLSIGDKKWKVYTITVSRNALRKYLESKGIVTSINNGF